METKNMPTKNEKKEYQSPTLIEYGDVEEITKSGAPSGGDGVLNGSGV